MSEIKIIHKIKEHSTLLIITSIYLSLSGFVYFSYNLFSEYLLKKIPKIFFLRSSLILFMIFILMAAWIIFIYFKNRNPLSKYEFDPNTGILRNKSDNLFYCPSCFYKKITAPLKKQEDGWVCLNKDCKTFYPNPEYNSWKQIKSIPRTTNWVHGWKKY